MGSSDIVFLDACELARRIAAREISSVETMAAFLDRIERVNRHVNAIVALRPREVLIGEAREHDELLAKGVCKGPLHGLPLAVKDLVATKDIVTTMGSPLLRDFVPRSDALVVERMRAAGAIVIGKTNTPEFGLGSHTYNPVYGTTLNAWDRTKSAGGSSGGAAVALALRMLPIADGSDYGGSLRNPAGWNNVCGFRTSFGLVPPDGLDGWAATMGVAGPMARNIGDLALLLSVMAGHEPRAPLSLPGDGARFREILDADVKGMRIGFLGDLCGAVPYEPGVLALVREALRTFEGLGCAVEDALPDHAIEPVWQAFLTLRHWHAGNTLRPYYAEPAKRALLKPEARYEVEAGAKLGAFAVSDASTIRTAWSQAVAKLFARFDALVMPTAQVFAFDASETWPRTVAGETMRSYHEWMKGVCLVSMAGCPALAVPAGFNEAGLAMGLQIIAPIHGEMTCLRLAQAYERATGFPQAVPGWAD